MVAVTGLLIAMLLLAGSAQADTPLSLQYWAVEGSNEGRAEPSYDNDAQAIRDALHDLRFDTFRTVRRQTVRLQPKQESRIPLKDRYTLILQFRGREADGRARVAASVEQAAREPDVPPRIVVTTNLILSSEKARIGGLRTEAGELVLVFAAQ